MDFGRKLCKQSPFILPENTKFSSLYESGRYLAHRSGWPRSFAARKCAGTTRVTPIGIESLLDIWHNQSFELPIETSISGECFAPEIRREEAGRR